MLISPLLIDVAPVRKSAAGRSVPRIVGYAVSIILHGLLLMHLLRVPAPMPPMLRAVAATDPMHLVLIEAAPPAMSAVIEAPRLHSASATPARSPALPASPTRVAPSDVLLPASTASTPITAAVDAHDLYADIEEAAAEIVATDPRLPNAGMPSAIGKLPGRAEPFIHLPLQHQEGGGFSRALAKISKHMILGGLPQDPLRAMSDRAAGNRGGGEPVCNDPENPLADERCWLPPED